MFRILFKTRLPERNDLFLPGRMAYVVDLEDYLIDSDIPNTLIRSKADCPSLEVSNSLHSAAQTWLRIFAAYCPFNLKSKDSHMLLENKDHQFCINTDRCG